MFSGVFPSAALMSTLLASCAIALMPIAVNAIPDQNDTIISDSVPNSAIEGVPDSVIESVPNSAIEGVPDSVIEGVPDSVIENPPATQGPMELPGRPPVDPIEFPTETPAAPVETPTSQAEAHESAHEEAPAENSAGIRLERAVGSAVGESESVVTDADVPPVNTEGLSNDGTISEERAESVSVPWRKFTNEAGKFRIAMPSQPARYTLGPAAGIDDSQMYMQLQLVDGAYLEIYAAAFVESANFTQSRANPESALLDCVTGLGELPERSEPQYLSSRSERGVEMTFRGADGEFQVSRCYLVGDRAYMLTVSRETFDAGTGLTPLNEVAPQTMTVRSAGMDVFFDSFEVLN